MRGGGRWGTPRRGPGSLARPPRPSPGFKPGLGRRNRENWPGAAAASLIAHRPSWWGAQTRLPGVLGLVRPDAVTPAGGPPDRLRARPPLTRWAAGSTPPPSSGIGCQARVPELTPHPHPHHACLVAASSYPRPEEGSSSIPDGSPGCPSPTHPLPHTPLPQEGLTLASFPSTPQFGRPRIPVWSQMKD